MSYAPPFKIPTDNLYKFIALTGLALVVLGGVVLTATARAADSIAFEASRTMALDSLEWAHMNRGDSLASIPVNASIPRRQPHITDSAYLNELIRQRDSLRRALVRDSVYRLESVRYGRVLESEKEQGDSLLAVMLATERSPMRTTIPVDFAYSLFYLGFALMLGGFGLWYWLEQRFHDTILRLDARNRAVTVKRARGAAQFE